MDVYFLRHGESLFNIDPANDFIDCSLTSNGIKQCTQLDFSSFPCHYSLIISSPLSRCRETLKHSPITYSRLEINDLFREIRSGCQSDLLNSDERIVIENEEEIRERIVQINNYLLEKKQEENLSNLLIVTHADLIWNLTSKNIDGEFFGTWLDNAKFFFWKRI